MTVRNQYTFSRASASTLDHNDVIHHDGNNSPFGFRAVIAEPCDNDVLRDTEVEHLSVSSSAFPNLVRPIAAIELAFASIGG